SSGLAVQSRRLKHDGNTANIGNGIHLLAIERDDIATIMFDKSARNERNVAAESFPGPAQHVAPICGAEQIHIASIHVDGTHQAAAVGCNDVLLEGLN